MKEQSKDFYSEQEPVETIGSRNEPAKITDKNFQMHVTKIFLLYQRIKKDNWYCMYVNLYLNKNLKRKKGWFKI